MSASFVFGSIFGAASALGAVVVDNIAPSSVQIGILGASVTGSYQLWGATAFTTGPGGPWQINSVTMPLDDFSNDDGFNPDQVAIQIRAESGGAPAGSALAVLTTTDDIVSGSYLLTPTAPLTLSASTTYWLVGLPTDPTSLYQWNATSSYDDSGALGWSIGSGSRYSQNSGATWPEDETVVGQFSIDAQVVPEPGSLMGGVVVLTLLTRRKH